MNFSDVILKNLILKPRVGLSLLKKKTKCFNNVKNIIETNRLFKTV